MEEIEQRLREVCADDSRLRLLEVQWEYDKNSVRDALQAVATTFPHYSRHDASHSNTILVNVLRILGDRLRNLSATDLWMLLEASYWHDVGMIVNDHSLRSTWITGEFRDHLEQLLASDDAVLASSAALLSQRSRVLELDDTWPVDVRQALTFVAADFFRRAHATKSAEAVRSPRSYGIQSPRSPIPQRLFEWLALVCSAHGEDRDRVMTLPYEENGIAADRCHPRFIAFMLRLGDLLDLDNGRFCPVLLASIGRIPMTSAAHIGKHASIRRFAVTEMRIEVEAVCFDDPLLPSGNGHQAYQAVALWLSWLEAELKHVAAVWTDIAPKTLGGGPPSVGRLRASLQGYELVPGLEAPEFGVDAEYFLELSKGSNLFGDPTKAWQRELLANAVDATLIRIWHTLSEAEQDVVNCAPDITEELRRRAANLPIRVDVHPVGDESDNAESRRWRVCISDSGCGMGLDEVRALQVVGSSPRNHRRRRLIADMPEALKPTGSFGIGFQSVFLDVDEVEVVTSDLVTRNKRRIVLRRAAGGPGSNPPRQPSGVYIEPRTVNGFRFEPGTSVSLTVSRRANFGKGFGDPLSTNPAIEQWRRDFEEIAAMLLVPVEFNGSRIDQAGKDDLTYFDSGSSIRFTFLRRDDRGRTTQQPAYRGVHVGKAATSGHLVGYVADLYAGRASEFLRVDRSSWTAAGHQQFRERLGQALPRVLEKYLGDLRVNPETDPRTVAEVSLFSLQNSGGAWVGEEWKNLPIVLRANDQSVANIDDVLAQNRITVFASPSNFSGRQLWAKTDGPDEYWVPPLAREEVLHRIGAAFGSCRLVHAIRATHPEDSFDSVLCKFDCSKQAVHGEIVEPQPLLVAALPHFPGRHMLPSPDRYSGLRYPGAFTEQWARIPAMPSPFVFEGEPFDRRFTATIPDVDRYLARVLEKRNVDASQDGERRVVAELTYKLCVELDKAYERVSTVACAYDLADVRRQLNL